MKLKILFFPLTLVTVVIIGIWYIWPAYQESVAHKETLAKKQVQLNALEQRRTQVDGLSAKLNRNIATKNFIFRYIPLVADEEYVINAMDNIAKVAAVNLVVADVLTGSHKKFFDSYNVSLAQQRDVGIDANAPVKIKRPFMEEFAIDAIVVGTYDNMKKFIDGVHKIDRMHGILSVKLGRVEKEDQATDPLLAEFIKKNPDEMITGQFVISFAYMGDVKIPRGAGSDVFDRGIDLERVQGMQEQYTSAPTLNLDNMGRPNPFVQGEIVLNVAPIEAQQPENGAVEPAQNENVQN